MKVLILEDEKKLYHMLAYYLSALGYNIFQGYNSILGLQFINTTDLDLLVLDPMLPGMDGLDILMRLELGADDYITKPFSMKELVDRIRAVFRRSKKIIPEEFLLPGIFSLDIKKREITKHQELLIFTTVQFNILEKMLCEPWTCFHTIPAVACFSGNSF